jgi:hypothetical protein
MIDRVSLMEMRIATLDSLLQLLYADHLWDPREPYRLVDFFSEQIRHALLADEAREGPEQQVAMTMTELSDVFFQQVRAHIRQRLEREQGSQGGDPA